MIKSLLIANRGEIACRISAACRRLGIRAVAVYSEADAGARHVRLADEALLIGPPSPTQSYLSIDAIIDAARRAAVDAIHPGYGFLAENADLARACAEARLIFVGPSPEAIAALGDKRTARHLAAKANLPLIPGYSDDDQSDGRLIEEAENIGYPLLVKAAAGGGGRGMRLIEEAEHLADGLVAARNEALKAFGSQDLLLEKALSEARHVEIQILADRQGHIIHLGERECSVQRRFQKVIEETPSPAVTPSLRANMGNAAVDLARAVDYQNAGTVEFLLDSQGQFYFLEMNTRLQVEHPITEMVSGIDLLEWQIRIAEGESLPLQQEDVRFRGHAIEARLYAENPQRDFLPVTGDILFWQGPQGEGIRVDAGLNEQDKVSAHYDPLLAKIIAHAPDRKTAVRRLIYALEKTVLLGLKNNRPFLIELLENDEFQSGDYNTRLIADRLQPRQAADADTTVSLLAVALARYQQYQVGGSGHWRNNPNQPLCLPFAVDGSAEKIEVNLTPDPWQENLFEAAISSMPDKAYILQCFQFTNNALELSIDGQRQKLILARKGDQWWVHGRRSTMPIQALPRLPKPRPHAGSGASLRAPMPGSVLAVLVEVGQEVSEGQALIKLEAMKMEHTIRTAVPGRVEAIYYKPGDNVQADAQLLKISDL